MSLRRSARLSTSSTPATPETNGTIDGEPVSRYKKTTTAKKRKGRASASTPKELTTNDEAPFLTGIINAPKPEFAVPEVPKTPQSKRRKAATESPLKPPPFTPTPSGVNLVAHTHPYESDHPLEGLVGLKPRPAEPHATNAPLATPGGSRVVAYSSSPVKTPSASQENTESPAKKKKASVVVPPDVGTLRPPTSTVDTLLKDACEHLCKVDPKLKVLIEKHHCKIFSPDGLREVVDPFTALASGIIGQQVRKLVISLNWMSMIAEGAISS